MKVHFDPRTDAVYFRLADSPIVESEEIRPGVVLDYNEHNEVVGVEILHAGQRVPAKELRHMQFEVSETAI